MGKPLKYRIYDIMHYTGVRVLQGVTLVATGLFLVNLYRFSTVRRPEIDEEIRLLKEAQLEKEQVEREALLQAAAEKLKDR